MTKKNKLRQHFRCKQGRIPNTLQWIKFLVILSFSYKSYLALKYFYEFVFQKPPFFLVPIAGQR